MVGLQVSITAADGDAVLLPALVLLPAAEADSRCVTAVRCHLLSRPKYRYGTMKYIGK